MINKTNLVKTIGTLALAIGTSACSDFSKSGLCNYETTTLLEGNNTHLVELYDLDKDKKADFMITRSQNSSSTPKFVESRYGIGRDYAQTHSLAFDNNYISTNPELIEKAYNECKNKH